jgi:hypothetical protein
VSHRENEPKRQIVGLVGIGLDGKDGHHRITRSDQFLLVGGSEATHEHMQDTAVRFEESLRKSGKCLQDTPAEKVVEMLHKALGS